MKFVIFLVVVLVAVASAQFGDFYGGGVYGPGGMQNFAPFASVRDPRQNTGPVVFPPSPPGNPADSSGVVVGASGYGFVPPSNQGYFRLGPKNFFFK
ncbi:uncharacterized protein LOC143909444 [Arctopsyche grandis]|uniref:uncharacterized protein LOC143909444 n=1 Tax=Arctopsyche grandis TaxID=121162 RepID=UPI00406D8E44